jgi:hypothetical protein
VFKTLYACLNILLLVMFVQTYQHVYILLQTWLKQPLVRVEDIKMRHDVLEAMVEDAEMRERLRDQHLRGRLSDDHYSHPIFFPGFFPPS